MSNCIGFMQGRLSPLINGEIQAFPWEFWRNEFLIAQRINMHIMEWTLDQASLYKNPIMTIEGQEEILKLSKRHMLAIPSLTGDCFMQAPLWKSQGERRRELEIDFNRIVANCSAVGISMLIIPLVDNGRLESLRQEDDLVDFLNINSNFLQEKKLKILFESDYEPTKLARFINRLDPEIFGINYDIGNSAALGFDVTEEFHCYGERIVNVHVKDRLLGGSTVPLGAGNVNFNKVFSALAKIGYNGNFILQTARAVDDDHAGVLSLYRNMTAEWIVQYAI